MDETPEVPTPPEPATPEPTTATVDIAASADAVWNALTSPAGLAPWMGAGAHLDPRPGGRVSLPDIATGTPREGTVDSVDEGRRLEFTWWPADRPDQHTNVVIVVEPAEHLTRLLVQEACVVPTGSAWAWRCALCTVSVTSSVCGAIPR